MKGGGSSSGHTLSGAGAAAGADGIFSGAKRFFSLDDRLYEYARDHNTIYLRACDENRRTIQRGLETLSSATILVLHAGSYLLENPSAAVHAGAGGASARGGGGGSAGAADGLGSTVWGVGGFTECTYDALFGSPPLAQVAADGYRFFMKGVLETGAPTAEVQTPAQAKRFNYFQKDTGKYYVSIDSIEGTNLPAREWDRSPDSHLVIRDPYVVIRDSQLAANKKKINTFFAAHPGAVAVLDVGTEPYVKDGVFTLDQAQLPESIKNLAFTNTSGNVREIGRRFLRGPNPIDPGDENSEDDTTSIKFSSINLNALIHVLRIGESFLRHCTVWKHISYAGFTRVSDIGSSFFFGLPEDPHHDMSPFRNVLNIHHVFFYEYNADSFDFRPFVKLKKIKEYFLYASQSSNLTLKGLSYLVNLEKIGKEFIRDGDKITPDLTPDFPGAPEVDLYALAGGGPRAVAAIRTPEFLRFHGLTPAGMSERRVAWLGAVARGTAKRAALRPSLAG